MVWRHIYYFIYTFKMKSPRTANANVLIQTEPEELGDIFLRATSTSAASFQSDHFATKLKTAVQTKVCVFFS